jgi:hypothetical protein
MATYTRSASNGVSFGTLITAVAADQSAGLILVDFQTSYNLVAAVMVTDANNEIVSLSDAAITYPAVGQIQIANGDSLFTVTTGYVFHIIAQRRKAS